MSTYLILTDKMSIFLAEIIAIMFGLHWIEQLQPLKTVICSDSVAALWGFSSIQATVMVETHNALHITEGDCILLGYCSYWC